MKRIIDTEKRIQNARNRADILQIELADYLRVSIQTISKMENGKTSYNKETATKIADFLEIDYRYLTYERNYMSFDDMKKETCDAIAMQEQALFNLLESYGYVLTPTNYYCDSHNYFCGDETIETEFYSQVYKVTTPNKETKYIAWDTIEALVYDMFVLLDNKLIHNDARLTWDIEL